VWVLLPMMINYFNDYTCARSLGSVVQIKIVEEPSLVFLGLWFDCLWLPSEKYKIVTWRKKEFKYIKDFFVFLDFIL
jgi:hypothetical protein